MTAAALLVAVAYYAGANLGFVLRLPPATPSVLWPPNTILTAALLLSPPRRWGVFLLAALPAHLAAELGMGWPISLVVSLFVTNCSQAVIAAAGIRWFSDAPARFDTLRRVTVFILAAGLVAPFLSSFPDAAAVTVLQGEPYWFVWRTRFFSNVVTELMLGPAIVMALTAGPAWVRSAPRARKAEAAALVAALTLGGGFAFGALGHGPGLLEGASVVVVLLPLILLATVRFGPGGASLALLTTSLIAIWAGAHRRGPFAVLPLTATETVVEVQILLIALAIPMLCLAAVVVERRAAARALAERLRLEVALSRLSAAFVRLPSDAMDPVFERSVREVGEIAGVDRVVLCRQLGTDGRRVRYTWSAPGADPAVLPADDFPWTIEQLRTDQAVVFSRLEELPAAASRDVESFRRHGVRSAIVVPLLGRGRVPGALALLAAAERTWRDGLVQWLRLAAEIFDNAMARKEGEDALRASELDAQRSRHELAHFTRVSTMGQLTASIAHELNQPLTGILTNARAGLRFLDAVPPDVAEVREILRDIVDDDKRAGEVIRRLRDLLRKEEPQRVVLDLNVLVRDVVRLLGSDAIIRNVTVRLDLAPHAVLVSGDRVELEQVVLNLLLNAMDAMAEVAGGDRTIVVTTENAAPEAHVVVRDSGPGFRAGCDDLIFEPFFTTKPAGMGMGLAISRSIVEGHGGSIRAVNHPGGGAVVHVTLPVSSNAA